MHRWKKPLKYLLIFALALLLIYFLGPSPRTPQYNNQMTSVPAEGPALESFIHSPDAGRSIKPDNESRIVWYNDSIKNKTPYSIVYLHGFSSSQGEGAPLHQNLAKAFGCNLYLPRLHEHGLDTSDALVHFTAEGLWESSKTALAVGRQLGEKVILIGTSTGGSAALQLASVYPEIAAIILISPNIEINDDMAWMLNNPWGKQIAGMVLKGNKRYVHDDHPDFSKYWDTAYRVEALVQLQEYLETAMLPGTFKRIKQPALVLAYYKDESHQDDIVRVSGIRKMYAELGTATDQKQYVEMPDVGHHVMSSPIKSSDVAGTEAVIARFLQEKLGMTRGG